MITFILWTALIGVGICAAVWLLLIGLILARLTKNWHRGAAHIAHNLPPPERQAERTFGQQYFERAIGRKSK